MHPERRADHVRRCVSGAMAAAAGVGLDRQAARRGRGRPPSAPQVVCRVEGGDPRFSMLSTPMLCRKLGSCAGGRRGTSSAMPTSAGFRASIPHAWALPGARSAAEQLTSWRPDWIAQRAGHPSDVRGGRGINAVSIALKAAHPALHVLGVVCRQTRTWYGLTCATGWTEQERASGASYQACDPR
jgi:hypothetical protein